MIDLVALRSLKAVDEHGSVVAAAVELGFTPSAVSQQIKRLERQSGVDLLERVGRGVILSGPGRLLVAEADRISADLERLESDLHAHAGEVVGEIRLVGFSTAMRGLIGPVVARLDTEHADLRIRLVELEPWDAVDQVAAGQADVGLVHRWGDVVLEIPDHLERRVVHRDEAEVILRGDHPLAGRRSVTPHDLVDERWIATPESTICRQWLHRMYAGTGRLPQIEHVSMEFASHTELVAAGLGIALVPRLGRAELPPGTKAVRVTDPVPEREAIAIWRRSQDRSPAVRAIVEALAAAGSLGQPKRPLT
ncbi:LysR family transcriptional regulator [Nocardioides marmorisolisilvae]|uniref:LysR family transcriptional regulator n=1 Tax=Nocardioides marmorisolisilvae TaxID=1542737 RepID=A0A3N0DXZ6_9ACTN|nr:LysR family transcriptional regulator [Nocardioides marmorisolisilvae]RNL80488.1 LysR family transcriptional regulator [Nocardioides marmorisolisilvae]